MRKTETRNGGNEIKIWKEKKETRKEKGRMGINKKIKQENK
jgi:hypothetical protein